MFKLKSKFIYAAMITIPLIAGSIEGAVGQQKELNFVEGPCVCIAPLSVARMKGFLDEELAPLNVKASFHAYDASPPITAALQSGSLDIAIYGAAIASLIASEVPIKIVMMADNPESGEGLAVKEDIKSVNELVGKKIAVALGTSGEVMLRGVIDTYGLPADAVEIVNLDPPSMAAAWEREDIQGAYIWDPWLSALVASKGAKLVTDGQLTRDSKGKYNAGWDVWVVRAEYAEQNPEVIKAVVRALDKGAKYIVEHPDDAAKAIYEMHGAKDAADMGKQLSADQFPNAEESRSDLWLGSESGKPGKLKDALLSIWKVLHSSGKIRKEPSEEDVIAVIEPKFLK